MEQQQNGCGACGGSISPIELYNLWTAEVNRCLAAGTGCGPYYSWYRFRQDAQDLGWQSGDSVRICGNQLEIVGAGGGSRG